MRTQIYRFRGKIFRYRFDDAVVEHVAKADADMIAEEKDWIARHGTPLLDLDADGYFVLSAAGLSRQNWTRKSVRDEYLEEWCCEIDAESSILAENFMRYEMPQYEREAS